MPTSARRVSRRRSVRSRAVGWSCCPPTPSTASVRTPSTAPPSPRCCRRRGAAATCPCPCWSGSWHTIDGLVYTVPHSARELIQAFWPGALSLVVRQAPSLQWDLGDAHGTVMLRMPLHPVAIELLREVGPMAVSSANISGRPAAVTVDDARDQLGDLVEVYLDGGPSDQQAASTIVDLTGAHPRVLREGPVTVEAIAKVLGVEAESLTA